MKCPQCKEIDLTIADRSGVEIDYCPTCRGIWLDRGELDKIIDRSLSQAGPTRQERLDPPPYEDRNRRRNDDDDDDRGPGGFLRDLFDF